MCFCVPYKVLSTDKKAALIEDGRKIKIGNELKVEKGDYLQVLGNVAVGRLTKSQGLKIRRLIKSLNSYDAKN